MDAMFEIPGSDICRVEVTEAAVRGEEPPKYHRQSQQDSSSSPPSSSTQQQHVDEPDDDRQLEVQLK